MMISNNLHREIAPLSDEDSFLVFDRVKDNFDFPVHYHPEFEINFILNVKKNDFNCSWFHCSIFKDY